MTMRLSQFLAAIIALFVLAAPLSATERITSFHAVIDVAKSGTLTVTETIKVIAEGSQIKRGIFRDFPTTLRGDDGRIQHVGFNVVSVERDGAPEDWFIETIPNGKRIYVGKADVFLTPGEYSYQITYQTNRQIRYFDTHEELYWNVTGNFWSFAIMEASATVNLPAGVRADRTDFFTGPLGHDGKKARVMEEDGEIFFATTFPLNIGEGLTIAVSMPKGSIDPPTAMDERMWWLRDNFNLLLGAGGVALVILYYIFAWLRVGRDPSGGVVVPRWDPPDGLSPAMINYIDRKGFTDGGWTALAATALDLAVRELVVIDDVEGGLKLTRTDKPAPQGLRPGETELMARIGGPGGTLMISKANGKTVQALGTSFTGAINKIAHNVYYKANGSAVFLGLLLTAALYAAMVFFGDTDENTIAFLLVPGFIAAFFGTIILVIVKVVIQGGGSRIAGYAILAVVLVMMLFFVGTIGLAMFGAITELHHWALVGSSLAIILANLMAIAIMGAPTKEGARLMAGIKGLRQYLTLAERDRLNMAGAPKMSPKHYETMLPLAVALGVEKPWSESFQHWLESAAAAGAAADYQPAWYHGDRFDRNRFSERMTRFTSSMASTMTASLPAPPKSSSSGFSSSGGRSGGGGGGGGGGGW